jgi:hypothetical protein
MFVSCSQFGVVPAVLAFFFYETDTPARVVSLNLCAKDKSIGSIEEIVDLLFPTKSKE